MPINSASDQAPSCLTPILHLLYEKKNEKSFINCSRQQKSADENIADDNFQSVKGYVVTCKAYSSEQQSSAKYCPLSTYLVMFIFYSIW